MPVSASGLALVLSSVSALVSLVGFDADAVDEEVAEELAETDGADDVDDDDEAVADLPADADDVAAAALLAVAVVVPLTSSSISSLCVIVTVAPLLPVVCRRSRYFCAAASVRNPSAKMSVTAICLVICRVLVTGVGAAGALCRALSVSMCRGAFLFPGVDYSLEVGCFQ